MHLKAASLLYLGSLISVILDSCNCLTFLSGSKSYAEYPPWNADVSGRVEFRFKTFNPTSLLLYVEEQNNRSKEHKSFLELSLLDTSMKLVVQMGGEDFWSKKERRFGGNLNDLKWHSVEVVRDQRKTTVNVDSWSFSLLNTGETDHLPVNSNVYVGGVPRELRGSVINGRVFYIPRFIGCIEDVAYSSNSEPAKPVRLLKAVKTAEGCTDACETHPDRHCGNGGKCINKFSKIVCDCHGTGYEGSNCTVPSISVYFRGLEYIYWTPTRSQSTPSHHIIIRFKTYLESGILFNAGSKLDFLIIEIYNGKLRLAIELGGGPLELIVGDEKLNDRYWHKIEMKRFRTYVEVILDNSITKNGTTPGRHSNFDVPFYEFMYFGGYSDPRQLEKSKSKQNFAGCMQHIFYNNLNILKFYTISRRISASGNVQKGCPVITSTAKATTTTTSTLTQATSEPVTSSTAMSTARIGTTAARSKNSFHQNSSGRKKSSLSKGQIAWITSGIIVGALVLVFTTACLVHRCKKRYDGFLLSSAMKNKDNQLRPNQRFKDERVVFLENAAKGKPEKISHMLTKDFPSSGLARCFSYSSESVQLTSMNSYTLHSYSPIWISREQDTMSHVPQTTPLSVEHDSPSTDGDLSFL